MSLNGEIISVMKKFHQFVSVACLLFLDRKMYSMHFLVFALLVFALEKVSADILFLCYARCGGEGVAFFAVAH